MPSPASSLFFTVIIIMIIMIRIIIDLQYLAAAGFTYVIRGCAPFTTNYFSPAVARSIEGNYWRVTFIQSKVYQNKLTKLGRCDRTLLNCKQLNYYNC